MHILLSWRKYCMYVLEYIVFHEFNSLNENILNFVNLFLMHSPSVHLKVYLFVFKTYMYNIHLCVCLFSFKKNNMYSKFLETVVRTFFLKRT